MNVMKYLCEQWLLMLYDWMQCRIYVSLYFLVVHLYHGKFTKAWNQNRSKSKSKSKGIGKRKYVHAFTRVPSVCIALFLLFSIQFQFSITNQVFARFFLPFRALVGAVVRCAALRFFAKISAWPLETWVEYSILHA